MSLKSGFPGLWIVSDYRDRSIVLLNPYRGPSLKTTVDRARYRTNRSNPTGLFLYTRGFTVHPPVGSVPSFDSLVTHVVPLSVMRMPSLSVARRARLSCPQEDLREQSWRFTANLLSARRRKSPRRPPSAKIPRLVVSFSRASELIAPYRCVWETFVSYFQ